MTPKKLPAATQGVVQVSEQASCAIKLACAATERMTVRIVKREPRDGSPKLAGGGEA